MRTRPAVIVAALVLLASAPAAAAGAGSAADPLAAPVSLEDAVRTALANSREVRLSAAEAGIAEQGKTWAGAGRLPRLDLGAQYISFSEPPSAIINGMAVQTADQSIFSTRLELSQTIYDFGKTGSRVDQAAAAAEAAGKQAALTREQQAEGVIAAFLSARRAAELRAVAEESLATARAHRDVTQTLYEQGVVAKNDVLAADVQSANAEAALISAENQVELSRSRLALRMGYPGSLSATPDDGPIPVPEGPLPALDNSVAAAWGKRGEVRVQEAAVREAEASVAAAQSAFAPSLFGVGAYQYETNDLNPHKSVFSILVGGKVNLFSGFGDDAALREARLSAGRRKEQLSLARDRIALEVKAAQLAAVEAEKRKGVAGVAVARGEENLRIQNDRYREGLSINTEVLDAENLLTRAKVDLRNASYDLYEARYRVLAARGELLEFLLPRIGPGPSR